MLSMASLRRLVASVPTYRNASRRVAPALLMNGGFPGSFNISFSEPEHLDAYGQYQTYNRDFIYSKIQPCFRYADWPDLASPAPNVQNHLALFHIADTGGAIALRDGREGTQAVSFAIVTLWRFLTKLTALDPARIVVRYFCGSSLAKATGSKYSYDCGVDSDGSRDIWKNLGLSETQMMPDSSRNTFLALRLFGLATPWGYRNEILYKYGSDLIDIGTVEHLAYEPAYADPGRKLHRWAHSFVIAAVGLERLLLVCNNLSTISDCDNIRPLKTIILKNSRARFPYSEITVVEGLRVLHKIIVDSGQVHTLSRHRRQKINRIVRDIKLHSKALRLALSQKLITQLISVDTKLQPWDDLMQTAIDSSVTQLSGMLK